MNARILSLLFLAAALVAAGCCNCSRPPQGEGPPTTGTPLLPPQNIK
jgi:hypothetical protein